VRHSIITPMFYDGDDDARTRLCQYCFKDSELVVRLFNKLNAAYFILQLARTTTVMLRSVVYGEAAIKVSSMIQRYIYGTFIFPDIPRKDRESYTGATVIDVNPDFFDECITVLDYASLYPSIIRCKNLCYSTLIQRENSDVVDRTTGLLKRRKNLTGSIDNFDYSTTAAAVLVVSRETRVGVLPTICADLIGLRTSVRERQKSETKMARATLETGCPHTVLS